MPLAQLIAVQHTVAQPMVVLSLQHTVESKPNHLFIRLMPLLSTIKCQTTKAVLAQRAQFKDTIKVNSVRAQITVHHTQQLDQHLHMVLQVLQTNIRLSLRQTIRLLTVPVATESLQPRPIIHL